MSLQCWKQMDASEFIIIIIIIIIEQTIVTKSLNNFLGYHGKKTPNAGLCGRFTDYDDITSVILVIDRVRPTSLLSTRPPSASVCHRELSGAPAASAAAAVVIHNVLPTHSATTIIKRLSFYVTLSLPANISRFNPPFYDTAGLSSFNLFTILALSMLLHSTPCFKKNIHSYYWL